MSDSHLEVTLAVEHRFSRNSLLQWILPAFAAAVLVFLLIYPFHMEGRHWGSIFDFAHAPAFFTFSLMIAALLDARSIGWTLPTRVLLPLNRRRLAILMLTLFLGGAACELAQMLVDRSASLSDVAANTFGLVSAMLLCEAMKIRSRKKRVVFAALITGLLLAPGLSTISELVECYQQRQDFPLLASFERAAELNAWTPHGAEATLDQSWRTHGKHSMKLTLLKHKHPGSLMSWPMPDWTGYSDLQLDLYNPGEAEIHLGINIRDTAHEHSQFAPEDRFRTQVTLPPGQAIAVQIVLKAVEDAPANRKMQMDRIAGINLFQIKPQEGVVFHVDNIRLTQ